MLTTSSTLAGWLQLIRAEYLEVPGLHLTKAQIQRLWGIDSDTCDVVLASLIESRFLRRTEANRYARFGGGA